MLAGDIRPVALVLRASESIIRARRPVRFLQVCRAVRRSAAFLLLIADIRRRAADRRDRQEGIGRATGGSAGTALRHVTGGGSPTLGATSFEPTVAVAACSAIALLAAIDHTIPTRTSRNDAVAIRACQTRITGTPHTTRLPTRAAGASPAASA